jgi:hypothetical protein
VKTIALIMIAGFIALVGFSCVPPPSSELKIGQACQNGALNVHFLAEPFTPGYPYTHDPQVDPTAVDPNILADLTAAFNAAPPFFKDQLCSLNAVFISRHGCTGYDPSTCNLSDNEVADNSWGFREPDGDKYIGISLGLWNNTTCQGAQKICAPPFQTYQTRLLRALMDRTAQGKLPSPPSGYRLPTDFASPAVSPNTSTMSVLATLAHEFGHIYWWQYFVEPPGSEHANPVPAAFCGGSFYPGGRWEGAVVDVPPNRWVSFGYIAQPGVPYVTQLAGLLSSRSYGAVADNLHQIYSSGQWASALAAYSADEDFVETFQLYVLVNANPGLQILKINVGNRSDDLLRNVNANSELGRKLRCFGALPQLQLRPQR